jgi:DNA-3-methyladenine glycosylase I
MKRCFPKNDDAPLLTKYHDHEWGKLNLNENYLYEMMVLESFQSGLSWQLVLDKRENFRQAFAGFNVERVAKFTSNQRKQLLKNRGIIRNQRKIDAAINNACVMTKMHREGHQLCTVLTTLIPQPIVNHPQQFTDIPTQNRLSRNLAKEFKEIGFQFMGPVTTYSFLEAVGLINDHIEDCPFKYTTT